MSTQQSASRDLNKYILRMPPGMRQRIAKAAEESNRSMNAEIVRRLEESFAMTATLVELRARAEVAEARMRAQIKALEAAENLKSELAMAKARERAAEDAARRARAELERAHEHLVQSSVAFAEQVRKANEWAEAAWRERGVEVDPPPDYMKPPEAQPAPPKKSAPRHKRKPKP